MKKGMKNIETKSIQNNMFDISNNNDSGNDMKSNTYENSSGKSNENKKRNKVNSNQHGNHHIDNNNNKKIGGNKNMNEDHIE